MNIFAVDANEAGLLGLTFDFDFKINLVSGKAREVVAGRQQGSQCAGRRINIAVARTGARILRVGGEPYALPIVNSLRTLTQHRTNC